MHIQIEANKEELFSKRVSLVKSIADCIGEVDFDLKNRLIKAIDDKDKLFTDPVLLEVLKQWEIGYKDQTNMMLADISKVLDKGKLNKSLGSDPSWIGVDLDGTLAEYHEYKGPASIGKPISKMVDRVKEWVANNKNVKIMTARANPNSSDFRASITAIKKWCKKYIGEELPVVYEKDLHMAELWDDRAIQIQPNTGIRVDGLNKGEDEGISYFHYDIDDESLNKSQKGPFIGPRGGKWADPEHTIPWKEKQLSIKEDKPDVPVIPIEVPKQDKQKPAFVIREPIKEVIDQEPEKKKRGRPPGSKNKMTRVAIKEPPTFKREAIKEEPVKQGRGRPPKPQNVKEAESSLAYVSAKNIKLKKVASDDIHDVYQTNFSIDVDDAKIAMNNLREQGINATILEGDPGIVKIRKGFTINESDLRKALFIGPKGGKWANAENTIPYQDEVENKPIKREPPGSQLPDEVQAKLKELKVDKLPQATIPVSDVRVDFSGDIDSKAIITWKDTKGKVQSGYTPKFHEINAKKKWDRINKFKSKKKEIVNTLNEKLIKGKPGSIDHQGHTILAIIAETGLRPGSTESVRKHGHYGISTLKKDHIALNTKMAVLNFIGKEGKKNVTVVQNPVTLKALEYYVRNATEDSGIFNPNALDIGKNILPKGMKVKDLRTIKATESAERLLKEVDTPPPLTGDSKKDKRLLAKALLETSKKVATILNNTPSIAKASYIHPMVFEQWAKNVGASEKLWKEVG
jgi:DNA topoisomerase IB